MTSETPELRIVPPELWAKAQARIHSRPPTKSRPPGSGKRGSSLLSGLLRCGACGGSIVIVSRRYKEGNAVGYANFGCATNRSRGDALCANTRTVSERKVTEAVAQALQEQLTRPDLVSKFVESFSKHFDRLARGAGGDEIRELERQADRAAGRVKNITAAMAAAGFSEGLLAQLKEEEATQSTLRSRLAAASRAKRPKVLPHPRIIESYLGRLLEVLHTDKIKARELLGRHMPPLVLTPGGNNWAPVARDSDHPAGAEDGAAVDFACGLITLPIASQQVS